MNHNTTMIETDMNIRSELQAHLDALDMDFMTQIQCEVTQSCALPFAVPLEHLPCIIKQAAQWFWSWVDFSLEERYYLIKNSSICKGNKLNKTVKLPEQIMGVFGVHKMNDKIRYGSLGDFSIERMMLNNYGNPGVGMGPGGRGSIGSLSDVVMTLYEISTFDGLFNPPISYNYNKYSKKLVLLGNLGWSDLVIKCYKRCSIRDLYSSHEFFRLCVAKCKKSLSTIYGSFAFKLPGGVEINYDSFSEAAESELEELKEWAQENRAMDYFFLSGEH